MTRSIRFGEDFELDPGAYQLRRSGHPLKLERIPMEILLLLTEQRGQLVSREQIVERIWGKGVHLDTDNSINGAIRKIRQVLKDDPEQPRFILTVTGRGYRFIAPVVEAEGQAEGVDAHIPPPGAETLAASQSKRQTRSKFSLIFAAGLAALLLAAVGLYLRGGLQTRRQPSGERLMPAVFPVGNPTGGAGGGVFNRSDARGNTKQQVSGIPTWPGFGCLLLPPLN